MIDAAASWGPQQLAEFLGAVSQCDEEREAAREGVERAADALEAECAALVDERGTVVASVGWPRFDVPERRLAELAPGTTDGVLPVPGAGACPAVSVPLSDDGQASWLVLARAGDPFTGEERTLLRAMARGLGLTMRLLETIAGERALRTRADLAAAENVRLLETLRKRQRVLEAMARIQRAISRREPLQGVLETIVGAAGELLGDDAPALLLRDEEDPGWLVVAASRGYPDGLVDRGMKRRPVGVGVAGRAVAEGRLIVVEDYTSTPDALPAFVASGMSAAMAAPVHEDGCVIGSLILSSFRADRVFSRAEQDMLKSFAEHASLALTDARRVDAMLHQALHDALTGLPNRALFTDRLQHALTQGRRRGTACAVIFLDLDRFKTVNDSLGHAAGDELLVAVARRIDDSLRSADTAARLGGDEFAVLLEDLSSTDEAVLVADRIGAALSAPVVVQGREVFVKASVGIAVGRAGASELLRQADVAMYRAKAEGKGRARVFEEAMQAEVVERLELEGELLRAIERDEIDVHYQPVIALDGHTLAGFEALARWTHPSRGLVPPPQFIPLAEENGSIVALGRQILRTACRQAARWLEEFPAAAASGQPRIMSVNLSGRQLEDPNIVADVAAALEDSGLPASALVLEITETVLMHDTEATIARLTALKALGVRLAVDDFGTGYSSLRYLRRFPIDILKMAKPFVDGLDAGDDEGRALARAIVELATSLKLACIAEGIEAGAQATVLHELGCGLGQGYHFARPMEAAAMTALIAEPAGRAFAMPSTAID
jgi:diguanylate cyclase (GGDEF)-like protein